MKMETMNEKKRLLVVLTLLVALVLPMVVNQVEAGNPKMWVVDFYLNEPIDKSSSSPSRGTWDEGANKLYVGGPWNQIDYCVNEDRTVYNGQVYGVRIAARWKEGSDPCYIEMYGYTASSLGTYLDDYTYSNMVNDTTVSTSWETNYVTLGTAAKGKYVAVRIKAVQDPGQWSGGDYIYLDWIRVEILVPWA